MSSYIPRVKGMSWKSVEDEALHALSILAPQCLQEAIPVPIQDIVEFGLEPYGAVMRVDDLPPGTEAHTIWNPSDQRYEIILAPSTYSDLCNGNGRARMTCGHELGHFVLHNDVIRRIRESMGPHGPFDTSGFFRSRREVPPWENPERQAEVFGGRFLVPKTSAVQAIKTFGLSAQSIADTFQVSYGAADVRLRELRESM